MAVSYEAKACCKSCPVGDSDRDAGLQSGFKAESIARMSLYMLVGKAYGTVHIQTEYAVREINVTKIWIKCHGMGAYSLFAVEFESCVQTDKPPFA